MIIELLLPVNGIYFTSNATNNKLVCFGTIIITISHHIAITIAITNPITMTNINANTNTITNTITITI